MMYGYKKGYTLNALWGFRYGGVWHNQEEVERNKITCLLYTSRCV